MCKTEFCYVCGAPWKTCNCDIWDEARLLERAEGLVDNGRARDRVPAVAAPVPAAAPAQNQIPNLDLIREQQVANVVQDLRDNHECNHESFGTLREYGEEFDCEVCGETYSNWIRQCRQCSIVVCTRCRHNRI